MESVTKVCTRSDFQMELEFNTGETRIFDVRPYLEKGVYRRLKDVSLFKQAYVAFDTVCWPGEIDIAPETLYDTSVPLQQMES